MKSLKILIFIYILFVGLISFAQNGTVKGKVQDELGALSNATVSLIQVTDTSEIDQTYSLYDGTFSFTKVPLHTDLYVKVNYIGYSVHQTSVFSMNSESDTLELNSINLEMENEKLGTVTVITQKRAISFSDGKTVVDVQNSPIAKGSDAFSILNQLPGLSFGNGNEIQINGKSGTQVNVNGRKIHLKDEALKTYLESLPSDAIKNITLDTKPSAEYDSEGSAGILNIELKEEQSENLTGSITAGYTYQQKHLWNTNIFLSQQNKKWSWSLLTNVSTRSYIRDEKSHQTFNPDATIDWLDHSGKETQIVKPINTQLDLEYQIDKNQNIGTNLQLGKSKLDANWKRHSILKPKDAASQTIDSDNYQKSDYNYGILQVFYELTTDTLGSGLNLSVDASLVKRKGNSDFYNTEEASQSTEHLQSPSTSKYNILSGKADYKKVWKNNTSLGLGTKISQVDYDNLTDFYFIQNGEPIYDVDRSSAFSYKERIWAGYLNFKKTLHPKWDLQAGLRVEKTWGENEEDLLEQGNKRNYIDWFPNLQLTHKISDNYKVDYTYSRRIDRPIFDLLNQQIFYIDPYNYIEGNPLLIPQRSNSFSINQLIQNKYNIEVSFDRTRDFMSELPTINNETNQTVYSTKNVKHLTNFGININAPLKLASFWNAENSLTLSHQSYSLDINEEQIKNNNLFTLFKSQHQINLPYAIKLNLNFTVQSPQAFGYYTIHRQWWIDLGLQKSFLDDRLNVNLKFTDIFKTMNTDLDYSINGNSTNFKYMGNQSVGVQLQYNFGGTSKNEHTDFKPKEYQRIRQD